MSTATALPTVAKVHSDAEVEAVVGKYEDLKLANQEIDKYFVWPEDSRPDLFHDSSDFKFPIIDLSPVLKLQTLQKELQERDSNRQSNVTPGIEDEIRACLAAKANVEKEIRAACEEYGFFQVINHGFPMVVVEQTTQSFIQLFDLPLEVKTKISADLSGASVKLEAGNLCTVPGAPKRRVMGYNAMKRTSTITKTNKSPIWNEGFQLELPEVQYPGAAEEFANILWPEEPRLGQQWRSTTEEYGRQGSSLLRLLLDLMAAGLGLPEDSSEEFWGTGPDSFAKGGLRVNNYPVCAQPELTWGIHGHTDFVFLTLLHQDEVGGLQFRIRDGTWHGIRPIAGAFVVNVGDYCQAWTNGRFISPMHRAVASKKARRMSLVYLVNLREGQIMRPRPELVDAEHPLRYRPFSREEYMNMIFAGGQIQNDKHLLDRHFRAETEPSV